MDINEPLSFENAEAWRQWLARYHTAAKDAWLIIQKKNSTTQGLDYAGALEEALCYGWIDSQMKSIDGERFILRFSPRKKDGVWSLINKKKAEQLISDGKMTPSGLAAIETAKNSGAWEAAYTSKTAPEIPPDLELVFKRRPGAAKIFRKLANSHRTRYIVWINSAKTDAARRDRIKETIKRILAGKDQ